MFKVIIEGKIKNSSGQILLHKHSDMAGGEINQLRDIN